MKSNFGVTAASVALAVSAAANASAQESTQSYLEDHVMAPRNALELTVGTGYTQGLGMLERGVNMPAVVQAGIAADVGVGYRLDPRWSIGATLQYQELQAQRAEGARGIATGLQIAYHVNPMTRLDPWIQLGTGYRLLWEEGNGAGPNLLTHGFELARLTVGVDLRATPQLALGPILGADLNLPLWQNPGGTIEEPRINTFVYAGVQGRFDIGGETRGATEAAELRPTPYEPPGIAAPQPTALPPPEDANPASPSIAVSQDIARECGLDLDNVEKAPKFAFDESDLLPADLRILEEIAACLTTGPLKGKGLRLVGRADARGSSEYNMSLGARRAGAVAAFLNGRGVDATLLDQTSRGKLDATGHDETTWVVDRRVDIQLSR